MEFLKRGPSRILQGRRRRHEGGGGGGGKGDEDYNYGTGTQYYNDYHHSHGHGHGHGHTNRLGAGSYQEDGQYDGDHENGGANTANARRNGQQEDFNFNAFVQAEEEIDEMHLQQAQEIENAIGGAIGVAERSQGSLLSFNRAMSKERAVEMGRRVSSLRSLEEYNNNNNGNNTARIHHQQQAMVVNARSVDDGNGFGGGSSLSLASAGGGRSISSYRSKESLPTFLKVPKVEPGMILRMNSWESYASRDDYDYDGNGGSIDQNSYHQGGVGRMYNVDFADDARPLGNSNKNKGSLMIVGDENGNEWDHGDYNHRSWAKLREEEAMKRKRRKQKNRAGRSSRRFGAGGINVLRQASQRLKPSKKNSASGTKTKETKGGSMVIASIDSRSNDSDTSPEDVGDISADYGYSSNNNNNNVGGGSSYTNNNNPAAEGIDDDADYGVGLEATLVSKHSAGGRSTGSGGGDNVDDLERQAAVPVTPPSYDDDDEEEEEVPPRQSKFEARDVSVEVSLDGRLANVGRKKSRRFWSTKSFLRRKSDKANFKKKTTRTSRLETNGQQQNDFVSNTTNGVMNYYNNDDDDIAVSRRNRLRNGVPQNGFTGDNDGTNGAIDDVLTLGDAFVDWTLTACEPDEESYREDACFPLPPPPPGNKNAYMQNERQEVEIMCGDTNSIDSSGRKLPF